MDGERFVPDLRREAERLEVVEYALGEGGLIDNHLRWKERSKTPSSEIEKQEYGYSPRRFSSVQNDSAEERPSREPVDFTQVATYVLGEPYDIYYQDLVHRVNQVDSGWFDYLVQSGRLDEKQVSAMKVAAHQAYSLNTDTEDNLPAYTSTIFGGFHAMGERFGIKTPATQEWSRGIWTAEENGHMLSMNEYGKITSITNNRDQVASRTSQLRSGMEIELHHVIQLFAYVDWQEQSARLAHDRSADLFGPVGYVLQDRIGADESRHHYVYHSILEKLYKHNDGIFRDDVIRTLGSVLIKPVMPGSKGIPRFRYKAFDVHKSGIFGVEQNHQAARVVLKKLDLLDREKTPENLSDEGRQTLEDLRAQYEAEIPEVRPRKALFVLGETVTSKELWVARRQYAEVIGLPSRSDRVT